MIMIMVLVMPMTMIRGFSDRNFMPAILCHGAEVGVDDLDGVRYVLPVVSFFLALWCFFLSSLQR